MSLKQVIKDIVDRHGHSGLLDVGALLDAHNGWELYEPCEVICHSPNANYYIGGVLTLAEAYGENGAIPCRDVDFPNMYSMATGLGKKSFDKPTLWYQANDLTVMFSYAWKDSITMYFTGTFDLVKHDTSWVSDPRGVSTYPTNAPYPYVTRGQKHAIISIPHAIPTCIDRLIVVPHTENFGHFVLDYLPALLGLPAATELDGLPIVIHQLTDWQRDILAYFDVDLSRITVIDPGPEKFSRSIRFRFAAVPAILPFPFAIESIRAALRRKGIPLANGTRRLFIKRRTAPFVTQRLINQDDVGDALDRLGFETVFPEDYSFADRAKLFSEASLVVMASGAAAVNMMLAPENAVSIELLNSSYNAEPDNQSGANRRIAACLGQNFYRQVEPVHIMEGEPTSGMNAPFLCDISRLTRLIKWIDENRNC